MLNDYELLYKLLSAEQRRNELLEEILLELKNRKSICFEVNDSEVNVKVDD